MAKNPTTEFGLGYPVDPHDEQARREDAARKKKEEKDRGEIKDLIEGIKTTLGELPTAKDDRKKTQEQADILGKRIAVFGKTIATETGEEISSTVR